MLTWQIPLIFKLTNVPYQAGFGMGTSLTNDFKSIASDEKSKVPNIVIKLSTIDGQPCVKLSDDLAKVNAHI